MLAGRGRQLTAATPAYGSARRPILGHVAAIGTECLADGYNPPPQPQKQMVHRGLATVYGSWAIEFRSLVM